MYCRKGFLIRVLEVHKCCIEYWRGLGCSSISLSISCSLSPPLLSFFHIVIFLPYMLFKMILLLLFLLWVEKVMGLLENAPHSGHMLHRNYEIESHLREGQL